MPEAIVTSGIYKILNVKYYKYHILLIRLYHMKNLLTIKNKAYVYKDAHSGTKRVFYL